jgi:hypothetical protein
MARPRKDISDDQILEIERMAGFGLSEAQIAHCLGMHPDTLRSNKRMSDRVFQAIQKGKALAEQKIGGRLFDKALDGDLGAIVWWEKTRADRRETIKQEVKSEVTVVNATEVRERIASRLARIAASN